jgi:hypothetical protein
MDVGGIPEERRRVVGEVYAHTVVSEAMFYEKMEIGRLGKETSGHFPVQIP